MRVFVAGATGVIGQFLVPGLITAGHEVTGSTRSSAQAFTSGMAA
jgi:2-alkyl-3-oxoalkanoate reductase